MVVQVGWVRLGWVATEKDPAPAPSAKVNNSGAAVSSGLLGNGAKSSLEGNGASEGPSTKKDSSGAAASSSLFGSSGQSALWGDERSGKPVRHSSCPTDLTAEQEDVRVHSNSVHPKVDGSSPGSASELKGLFEGLRPARRSPKHIKTHRNRKDEHSVKRD